MILGRRAIVEELRRLLSGDALILGIGNTLREDDGAGPYFASLCRQHRGLRAFDCGEAPEKYIGKAISEKPRAILLVDAVDFGGRPGEVRLFDTQAIRTTGISTHDMSLRLLVECLVSEGKTAIALLAFQPRSMRLGFELGEEVKHSALRLAVDLGLAKSPAEDPDAKEEKDTDRR